MGIAYNYHLGNFLAATASYSIYNRSYSNLGLGVSITLGPFEIYALSDNVLEFGLFNPIKNFSPSNDGTIMVDTRNVRNGQFRFGMNLTFGREKMKKDPEDPNRASSTSTKEKSTTDKESNSSTTKPEKNKAINSTKSPDPSPSKRTDYSDKGKGENKNSSKKTEKTNYNKESSKKKKNKRKGPLVPKVEETVPKGSTFRKVSKKI